MQAAGASPPTEEETEAQLAGAVPGHLDHSHSFLQPPWAWVLTCLAQASQGFSRLGEADHRGGFSVSHPAASLTGLM